MPPDKKSPPSVTQNVSGDNNVVVGGDVTGNLIVGDNNTVNQTIIQKFFNIFKSDAETVDQRNRRIMLGHVENFWVKGILEKSLHGAALLDLEIKEDPDALTYPWAIKREANKETLPAGTSMLEIFQEIGLGRSLLILGVPGSGKTTMLLELTRQLIERAREDVTEPIPFVFNLSSWIEKLTLADWLARELNVIYTIPKKVAPTWVKENKMLLLLDGLDEVKQESRDKCVDAINQFRKENGLTSMAVCSRIQDYADIKTRLSFDGAIEIQSLTENQVDEYFKRFGKGLAGIRQVLEKDNTLREMAETPLFLSIMTLAYRDTRSQDILVAENPDVQRKHLFDTYIERMFERPERSKNDEFKKQDVLHWLSWLGRNMIVHSQTPYFLEGMQPTWLSQGKQSHAYRWVFGLSYSLLMGLLIGIFAGGVMGWTMKGVLGSLICGLISWLIFGLLMFRQIFNRMSAGLGYISTVDTLIWSWSAARKSLLSKPIILGQVRGWVTLILMLLSGLSIGLLRGGLINGLLFGVGFVLIALLFIHLLTGLSSGLMKSSVEQTILPGQRLTFTIKNFILGVLFWGLLSGLFMGLIYGVVRPMLGLFFGLFSGLLFGLMFGLMFIGISIIQHYCLRLILNINKLLPWRLIPFLDQCVDLIFLRRVGGGYIFVHRLLMEHFAAMYPEIE